MPAAAAIVVATVAAGTAGYQSYQASQDKSEAIDNKGRQEKLAEKAANDAKAQADQQTKDIASAKSAADATDQANVLRLMQQRRRGLGGQDYNKGGTLLTGPSGLGTTAPPNVAGKTLLGM